MMRTSGSDAANASCAEARDFAIAAHGDQPYGNSPYVVHLSAVVRVLESFGADEVHLKAGWLHDVVEDTTVQIEDVRSRFGKQVADLVWAVTGEGHGDRHAHSRSIYRKIAAHPAAASLKLADRIANVEACQKGDKHSTRYAREHPEFAGVIEAFVPSAMWNRYVRALAERQS